MSIYIHYKMHDYYLLQMIYISVKSMLHFVTLLASSLSMAYKDRLNDSTTDISLGGVVCCKLLSLGFAHPSLSLPSSVVGQDQSYNILWPRIYGSNGITSWSAKQNV